MSKFSRELVRPMTRPHVVILGAGASRAACPKGDATGKPLPVMKDLIEILDLRGVLDEIPGARGSTDFEEIYDAVACDPNLAAFKQELEARLFDYFSQLKLPQEVTLYDELVLSLRKKDLIATFNWDPLLLQAYKRNADFEDLPSVVHLHGNVGLGFCRKDRAKGHLDRVCDLCGEPFERSQLLYPVRDKRYSDDPFIASEWEHLRHHMARAFILTIIGYSAPRTDAAAVELMQAAWAENNWRNVADVEIVDVRDAADVRRAWDAYMYKTHYVVSSSSRVSELYRFPRRSCEGLFSAIGQNDPWSVARLPKFANLDELQAWIRPLADEDHAAEATGSGLRRFDKHVPWPPGLTGE